MTAINFSIKIKGRVQGVGFRPFVYKLASDAGVSGFVRNGINGVDIEIEGFIDCVQKFIYGVKNSKPDLAIIEHIEISEGKIKNYKEFEIIKSDDGGFDAARNVFVSPDAATCRECENDIFDPNNRRYLYPFTNCTNCGPRYTIIEKLPYDRIYTVMSKFKMCDKCQKEYESPSDRRFHAQPNACPDCGPGIHLIDNLKEFKNTTSERDDIYFKEICGKINYLKKPKDIESTIKNIINSIETGKIAAIMGLGGFHIACRADCAETINKLRALKNRPTKPFAMMAPDIGTIKNFCEVSRREEELLKSSIAPIVLLKKKKDINDKTASEEAIAPQSYCYGFMLPYTPLHKILMAYYKKPLIMTSGNLSDEPICYKPEDSFTKLSKFCDCALIHNRPILIPCDDSVMFYENEQIFTIRPARGISPYIFNPQNNETGPAINKKKGDIEPLKINPGNETITQKQYADNGNKNQILAAGGILKNTISANLEQKILVSQFIGDIDNADNYSLLEKTAAHIERLYNFDFNEFAADLHPDAPALKFIENKSANALKLPAQNGANNDFIKNIHRIQHHYAHALSVMAENNISEKVLALSFDGTGIGTDKSVWGGEFLICDTNEFYRAGHFEKIKFHNYDSSVRVIQKLLLAANLSFSKDFPDETKWINDNILNKINESDKNIITTAHGKNINCVESSSLGRIFDITAALCGFNRNISFEGEAAVYLEIMAANYALNNSIDIFNNDFYDSDIFKTYCLKLNSGETLNDIIELSATGSSESEKKIIIKWSKLFKAITRMLMNGNSKEKIALCFHISIAKIAVAGVIKLAEIHNLNKVCLSGGVFFNRILLSLIINGLQKEKLQIFTPKYLSFGDSSISAGQCYYLLSKKTN